MVVHLGHSVSYATDSIDHTFFNQLTIRNTAGAVQEAEALYQTRPPSDPLHRIIIRAYAEQGNIDEALSFWEKLSNKRVADTSNRTLLEAMCWGVLSKHSKQLHVMLSSVIGAALTQDVRALPILLESLRSSNALVRTIAASFSVQYRDQKVMNTLLELLQTEKVWSVRLALIESLGGMRVQEALPYLQRIVAKDGTLMEERQSAILAICRIKESATQKEVQALLSSQNTGERLLALEILQAFTMKEHKVGVKKLLYDNRPEVRVAAINCLVTLHQTDEDVLGTIRELADENHGELSITAAWALAHCGDEGSFERLEHWMRSPYPHLRQIASSAAALLACGNEKWLLRNMQESEDPFQRVMLAKGALSTGQRYDKALEEIARFLRHLHYKVMTTTSMNPLFSVITVSGVKQQWGVDQYPQYVDKVTRLELLNLLATKRYAGAEDMLKEYLREPQLGVTFNAALILLQEGSGEAIELVKGLLTDSDTVVQYQAAVLLANLGEEKKALPVLKKLYAASNREMKVNILQAIGMCRSDESIEFLLDVMKDPFLILRVVAASSIIQCVYR